MLGKLRSLLQYVEWHLIGPVNYFRRRGAQIGSCPIFSSPSLAEPHLCVIGNNVWITPRVTFVNHDGGIAMLYRTGRTTAVNVVGKIIIHDNVFIGTGTTIMPGVEIGPYAIVASGSVVTRDIPPNTVAGGSPAKPICSIDEYLEKYASEDLTLWVESEEAIGRNVVRHFMLEGRGGKLAIRLRKGKTRLTS